MKEFFKTIFIKENIFLLLLFLGAIAFGVYYTTPAALAMLAKQALNVTAFTAALSFFTLAAASLALCYSYGSLKELKKRYDSLNRLYQDTVAEKLNYKYEKEDLADRILDLEKEVMDRDRKIQELSGQVQTKEDVDATASQEQKQEEPTSKLIKDIDDIKATLVKAKKKKK